MSLQGKKLAQLVNEYRNRPDDRRCFNCESLGSTYYVPTFSIFVCTQCSGVHMQFGHRVKSVSLAEYKPEEVEQMRDGGNQVAAYRYLARYTPDKDLKKPLDHNPQHIRVWIQTVFVDKRFYSADAPVPRRPSDAGSSAAGPPVHSTVRPGSGALSRTSSTREGATSVSPVPLSPKSSLTSHQQHLQHSGSPPVRDVRELLGDKATALYVGPKAASNSSHTTVVTSAAAAPAAAPPASQPTSAPAKAEATAFDPFAAPDAPVAAAALPSVAAGLTTATVAAAAPAAAPAAAGTLGGWAAFSQAAGGPPGQVAQAAAPRAAAPAPGTSSTVWATFDDDSSISTTSAVPATASPSAAAATRSPAAAAAAAAFGGPSTGVAPAAATAAATFGKETRVSDAAGAASTPKGGKPAAKELAADLFSEIAYVQPGLATSALQHPGMLSGVGGRQSLPGMQQALGLGVAGAPAGGYGMQQQQQPPPAHQAWAMQQQAALAWQQQQHQQQLQQQQLLQQQHQMYGMHNAGAAGSHFSAAMQQQQQPGMMAAWGPVPGQQQGMNGVMYGASAGATLGWQQQHPMGSGLPSSSSNEVATAAAGVTEKNAFADLVDLKKALPNSGSTSAAGPSGMPQQPYGMHPAAAGNAFGVAYSMPGGSAAAGLPSSVGSLPHQPAMFSQLGYQQQVQHGLMGPYSSQAPPAAQPAAAVDESNNPFA